MSRAAEVIEFTRSVEDGALVADVKVDAGGGDGATAPHYADAGDDSQPLPGDTVALAESSGTGAEHVTGYSDPLNQGQAGPGEKRIYSRDPITGLVVAEVWLKGDGTVHVITAAAVLIGEEPEQALPLGNALIEWLAALTVPTAMGPSGTPINAAGLAALLSTKHKIDS